MTPSAVREVLLVHGIWNAKSWLVPLGRPTRGLRSLRRRRALAGEEGTE